MSEMVRHRRSATQDLLRLLWQQPLWAVPFALFFWLLGTSLSNRLIDYYETSLVFTYAIRLGLWGVTHFVIPRLRLDPENLNDRARWGIGLYLVAGALLGSLVAGLIVHLTIFPGFLGGPRAVLVWGVFTLLFSALFAGINYAIVFYRSAVERGRAVERVRAELAQAELRALRAQINPHFLFNTLNSIACLIAENPRAAEETTTRLAEIFRYALTASEHEHAGFAEELDFLRSYLEIERTRFGNRLRVEEAIEPGLESVPVPSLLLQPLVENAVRYAVAPRPEGGTVRLSARREGRQLVVEVSDDGPGFDGDRTPSGAGFGLHSVRERLRAAGLLDALAIESAAGRGTRVRITLPILDREPSHPGHQGVESWAPPNDCR
jgi:signal transduction histidine kinase